MGEAIFKEKLCAILQRGISEQTELIKKEFNKVHSIVKFLSNPNINDAPLQAIYDAKDMKINIIREKFYHEMNMVSTEFMDEIHAVLDEDNATVQSRRGRTSRKRTRNQAPESQVTCKTTRRGIKKGIEGREEAGKYPRGMKRRRISQTVKLEEAEARSIENMEGCSAIPDTIVIVAGQASKEEREKKNGDAIEHGQGSGPSRKKRKVVRAFSGRDVPVRPSKTSISTPRKGSHGDTAVPIEIQNPNLDGVSTNSSMKKQPEAHVDSRIAIRIKNTDEGMRVECVPSEQRFDVVASSTGDLPSHSKGRSQNKTTGTTTDGRQAVRRSSRQRRISAKAATAKKK